MSNARASVQCATHRILTAVDRHNWLWWWWWRWRCVPSALQTSISQTSGAPYACPNCSQAFLVTTSSHLGTSLVSCPRYVCPSRFSTASADRLWCDVVLCCWLVSICRCNTTLSVTGVAIGTALLPSSLPASSAAGGMSSDGGAAVGGSSQAAGAGDAYVRMPV